MKLLLAYVGEDKVVPGEAFIATVLESRGGNLVVVTDCHDNPSVIEDINPIAPGEGLVPCDSSVARDE